jgi:superfamily I DNA/RNA helicase
MDMNKLIPDSMKEGSTEKLPGIILSPMQEAILEAVETETDNLSIEAVAGSGKTYTILQAMQRARGDVLFLAFNKSIADELREKTPMGTDCKTFNALGHALLKRKAIGSDLDKWKLSKLLKPRMSSAEYKEWGWELIKLVGSIKASGAMEPLASADFEFYVEHSEIPMGRITYAAMILAELWADALDVSESFTFDDQLFMPVFWDMTFPKYDTVFVDEAQDLNPIQHMMLSKLAERGARIIAVGDSKQAIYGFRGALTNSMEELNTKFNCTEYPLSICYRCAKSIVRLAQEIVPQIEYHEDSPEGTITHNEDGICPTDIPPDSIIMCRTNAPMFRYAVQFLKHKVPCMVMSNFGEQLIKFVKSFDVTNTEDLAREIEIWRKKEIAEAESRELFHKINRINDKARSILPFCEEFRIKSQVVQALERLLRSDSGPRLCTIHKAKGLEAEYAYLLRPDLVPGPWIEPDTEEFKQEENLRYVAITRAKENLVFMMEYEDETD